MLRAAFRRFLGLLLLATVVTVVVALLFALLLDADLVRALSLGFYLMGSFLLVAGFFVGNRGPVRLKGSGGDAGGPFMLGSRFVRWATPDEREESINLSAIFVVLGLVLILIAIGADSRYELV